MVSSREPSPYDKRKLDDAVAAGRVHTDPNGATWIAHGRRGPEAKKRVSTKLVAWLHAGPRAILQPSGVWRTATVDDLAELDSAIERHPAGKLAPQPEGAHHG